MLHLNAFLFGCGHHSAAWRHPDSRVEDLGDIAYYEELAQIAERGKLDAVFFADGHSVRDPAGAGTWFLEPITALSAMARATTHIGLVTTVSTTFYTPFHAARMLASLDHISGGRAGWNVVTSMFDAEARNHGFDEIPGRKERYERAEEFVDVALALWDTWDADALVLDRGGMYADPAKVHRIDHDGKHFRVDGPLTVPRSPQGRPVLFQAGASGQGRDLAARYAEAIYAVAYDISSGSRYYADVKQRIAEAGRDASAVGIMPGLVTYVGSTMDEARAKKAELDALLPVEQSLRQLSMFVEQDCTTWELDAPVPSLPPLEEFTGPHGRYDTILRIVEKDAPTVRELLGTLAAGGGHATMIGTPESIADEIEAWVQAGAADGFNLMPPLYPHGLTEFVDHVVPILQARGVFRRDYAGSTLRENLR
ncbi:LLM class flavin-dependent oxidoreductase [Rhodococcus sp. BP-252]|uniref:LLM class flavin-dependent oxidoreductase n=1 Tax=unclassified Rhodococcus (in: high G+C Gram-positive bacteria) TaxID=192944 RepID=UPI0014309371|nr:MULTISPECIES: LLM class flavin-dependent oxidoreductase [unclassified Rhodococcus (in: high G+C Gram-positive bacteria)]MBY6413502.1 LLM class flavin-dependent oxidoreductase [Rhodococcus sp. BP-320]MBY6418196.1 LLM class flavin-dependent oxidoreductase [Rhodococcus sp. BP-321]MBY6422323.1 LLM class flavin-dependent oxidoreductase [Rhodococcus sp. BP-324]MBY6428696.1 LLM class flavin-dependent oxidoreductase [Rhodococcus sp. BP-323]MBY6433702.1 LLM class flavin-dependent oxidoreductase [Rho